MARSGCPASTSGAARKSCPAARMKSEGVGGESRALDGVAVCARLDVLPDRAVSGYAQLVGGSADAATFFVGSILFTAGGAVQTLLALLERPRPRVPLRTVALVGRPSSSRLGPCSST
jgi:hypothetical protein